MKTNQKSPQKIVIVGDQCRGKSTLAKTLSKKLNIDRYSTDDILWAKKYTTKKTKEQIDKEIQIIKKKKSWILEGSTRKILAEIMPTADQIILLEHKWILIQYYIFIKRAIKRQFNKNDDRESFGSFFETIIHLFNKRYKLGPQKGKLSFKELAEPHKDKTITLSSFKAINKHLEQL